MSQINTESMPNEKQVITVGVLALQGSYHEHIAHLTSLFQELSDDERYCSKFEFRSREVKKVEDLHTLDGLILPGGESTTMSILLQRNGLLETLKKVIQVEKLPCWGSCAGLILLCNEITNTSVDMSGRNVEKSMKYRSIGGLDVRVDRNSFGRQLDSFSENFILEDFDGELHNAKFTCVFIRAPIIREVLSPKTCYLKEDPHSDFENKIVRSTYIGDEVDRAKPEVLLRLGLNEKNSMIVAVKQGNLLGTSFHPELVSGDYRMHKWFIDRFIIDSNYLCH